MRRRIRKIVTNQDVCTLAHHVRFTRYPALSKPRLLAGFTLIELLVVIAIIALLLSIVMPGLSKAKEMASMINCLTAQKNIALSFLGYADDNKGKFCSGYVRNNTTTPNPPSWVKPPLAYSGSTLVFMGAGIPDPANPKTIEHEINGLREGALYPYLEDTKIFHCPGDRRILKGKSYPYRSYGFPDFYAAASDTDEKLIANLKAGGAKLLLVEDQYDNATYNVDAWSYIPSSGSLWDPLGNYHNKSCTFAMVDGHAENRKWQDKRTMVFCSDRAEAARQGYGKGVMFNPKNEDLEWLTQHYPCKTRLKGGD